MTFFYRTDVLPATQALNKTQSTDLYQRKVTHPPPPGSQGKSQLCASCPATGLHGILWCDYNTRTFNVHWKADRQPG